MKRRVHISIGGVHDKPGKWLCTSSAYIDPAYAQQYAEAVGGKVYPVDVDVPDALESKQPEPK